MFARYQGHIGAYLVLAGADSEGGHLYSIHAHGSTDKTPYTANGSGMLAAMAVLETGWKPGRSLMQPFFDRFSQTAFLILPKP